MKTSTRPLWESCIFKIQLVLILLIFLSLGLVTSLLLRSQKNFFLEAFVQQHQHQVDYLSQIFVTPLLYEDLYTLYSLARSLVESDSHIVWVSLQEINGKILLRYPENPSGEDILILSSTVRTPQGKPLAHLAVGLDTGEFARALSQTQKRLLLWTAIVALLSVGLILLFTSRITRPLAALLEGAWRISRGQIGYQIKSKAPGELGELLETFNRMSRDLQESIERLKNLHSQMVRAEKFYTLGQFAAGVAHEIRNPLTSITLALEFLKNNPQNPKAFEIIEKEIRHIDHLIQTFLDFARSHSLQLRHEEVQLNTLVAETLDLIKFQARKQGVKLESSLPPLPPLKSSPEALRQILLNLTLNALQAMPEGGLLRVETRQASEKVELIVEDTGPGIPEEVLSRIFEPFFTTKPQGTGLGLTITRNLVEILGGEIRVFSTPGKGTRFVVTLPLKTPEITDPSTGSRSQDYLFSGERNSRKTTSA